MIINNEYRIEADEHNWVLIQTRVDKEVTDGAKQQ